MAGRAWSRAGLVGAIVLLVDQVTKKLAQHHISVGEENSVFPALKLVHVKNRGVAFSAFEDQAAVVITVIAIAICALLWYFATHVEVPLIWLPTGLLAGGAIGNVLDRIREGAVTDFLKLPKWPAFNVADIAVTFGVFALIFVLEKEPPEEDEGVAPDGV